MPKLIPTEFEEQASFVEYLQFLYEQGKVRAYTALPNNLYTKSWKQKVKQKKEGLRPGFPDLCIITRNDLIFIEMKRTKGGILSNYQKDWQKALKAVGIKTFVAYGFDEAKEYLEEQIEAL